MNRTDSVFLHRERRTWLYGLRRQNTSCKRALHSGTNAKGRQPCTEGNRKSQCLVRIFLVAPVPEIGTGNSQADGASSALQVSICMRISSEHTTPLQ